MSSAGAAFRKNLTPNQIRSAFVNRGFVTSARERRLAQDAVLKKLQERVNAREWAICEVTSGLLPRGFLMSMPTLRTQRKSGRPRQPLGPSLKSVGLINGDDQLDGLVALMDDRKRSAAVAAGARKRARTGEGSDE